jgi:transmembrane sensor
MERDCLAWQARSAEHRLAFERCTEVWQEVPRLTLGDAYAAAASSGASRLPRSRPTSHARWRWAASGSLVALVFVGTLLLNEWFGAGAYNTGVGEQQTVALEDGSRMSLNTSTRVRVELSATQRAVTVEDGEALFEVAKDARRPFVVRVGGSEVTALGTVFSVRLGGQGAQADGALTVALIEGSVSVRSPAHEASAGAERSPPILMQPGQRMRMPNAGGALVDQPRMDPLVAWKRGEAVFDNVALEEAVAEMNRYSRTPIVLVGAPALVGRRVSGQFRTGDNASFARAVAALLGLTLSEPPGRLELVANL